MYTKNGTVVLAPRVPVFVNRFLAIADNKILSVEATKYLFAHLSVRIAS